MLKKQRNIRIAPTRGFIYLLSLGLIAWGSFVLNPLVDTFAANTFYANLAAIGPEWAWGTVYVTTGLTMAYGCAKQRLKTISHAAMLGFLLWILVATLYGLESPTITPIVTNSILALAHGWAWLVVKLEPDVVTNRIIWKDDEVQALIEFHQSEMDKREE